jgi:hypothetical protein
MRMQNVKIYLFQNRTLVLLLSLSTLIFTSWTIYHELALPSLISSVTLTKNFKHPPTVIDIDHQASDYWWDRASPQKPCPNRIFPPSDYTVALPPAPIASSSTTSNKKLFFSHPKAYNIPPLPTSLTSSHPPQIPPILHLPPAPFPSSRPYIQIFTQPQNTTAFEKIQNYTVSTVPLKPTNKKILTNPKPLLFEMSQRAVLKLSKPDSSAMNQNRVEKPGHPRHAPRKFSSTLSNWTRFLDSSYLSTKYIHISGLPIDTGEIDSLITQLRQFNYPIAEDSTDHLNSLIDQLRRTTLTETTAKGLHTVGSTSALGAYVFEMESERLFAATPMPDRILSIVELVAEVSTLIHPQTKTKGSSSVLRSLPTTIIITPYVLDVRTEDDTLILLRFYHFSVDAKPTIFHIIYRELTQACGAKAPDTIQLFQILPRLIPVDGVPTWVMDVLVPFSHTIPTAQVYHHFTGNAVGGTVMLDLGGIHCMVMAGLNIRETPMQFAPFTPTNWATIHDTPLVTLRYLRYLLQMSGVQETNIISIFYSKADQLLGKQTRTFIGQKKILERRAQMSERPTIVFASPAALQQFLQHFPRSLAWRQLQDACLGFAPDALLPSQTPPLNPAGVAILSDAFALLQTDPPIDILSPTVIQPLDQSDSEPPFNPRLCFEMSAQLLQMANQQLGSDEFQLALEQLSSPYRRKTDSPPNDDMVVDEDTQNLTSEMAQIKKHRVSIQSPNTTTLPTSNKVA